MRGSDERAAWLAQLERPLREAVAKILADPINDSEPLGRLVGLVMRELKGKGNPAIVTSLIEEARKK